MSQPLISGETEDGLIYRAHLRWLNEEFFLLEGVGGVRGWPGERKTAWIGWSLHPGVRLKAYLSFAEAGSLVVREGGPSLPVESLYRLPEGWPSWACPSPESLLDSLAGGALLPAMPSASGLEVEGSGSSRFPPSLGLLSGQELLRRADPWRAQGHFGGRGAEERGCPGGEGAAVFEGAQGDVLVEGGRVCGVLVTSGSLRIRGDGVWQGMALVGGDMVLEGAAGFEGLARVGGRLLLRGESTFRGSACAAFWALGGAPALRDPVLLQTGVVLDRF